MKLNDYSINQSMKVQYHAEKFCFELLISAVEKKIETIEKNRKNVFSMSCKQQRGKIREKSSFKAY